MNKLTKAKAISGIVFYSIWIVVAVALWIVGFVVFQNNSEAEGTFIAWMYWGAICVVPILIPILRFAFGQGKDGARRGANDYTATVTDTHVTVKNHVFLNAFFGFIIAVIGGVFAGPVMLAGYFIYTLYKLIKCIISLAKGV